MSPGCLIIVSGYSPYRSFRAKLVIGEQGMRANMEVKIVHLDWVGSCLVRVQCPVPLGRPETRDAALRAPMSGSQHPPLYAKSSHRVRGEESERQ